MPTRCDNPVNALLPWLLNGTLEGAEEAEVKDHVAGCGICSEEVAILSEIGRAVDASAGDVPAPAEHAGVTSRLVRAGWAVAAGIAFPAALGIWWALLGFPFGHSGEPRAPASRMAPALRSGTVLNLGGGASRGEGEGASFRIPEGIDEVTILFTPPVDPDARYAVELRGPDGALLGSRDGFLTMDRMSRSALSVSAASLARPGDYVLSVRERDAAGEDRVYRYPFRLEPGTNLPPD